MIAKAATTTAIGLAAGGREKTRRRLVQRVVLVLTATAVAVTGMIVAPAQAAAAPTIQGFAHVQNIGDVRPSAANPLALGTTGRSLRVEGMTLSLKGAPAGSGITYRVHIQDVGWQGWKSNGQFTGSRGKSQRLEGFYAYLTGPIAQQYTLQYRAHVQNIGWQGWKNGGTGAGSFAGTEGRSLRMERLDFRLVPKPTTKPTPAPSTKEFAEAEAAKFGLGVVWKSLPGAVGYYSESSPKTIYLDPAVKGYSTTKAANVVRHEAAHAAIDHTCGTGKPPITGSRWENVTEAYAILFYGASLNGPYSVTAADKDVATKIRAGQCTATQTTITVKNVGAVIVFADANGYRVTVPAPQGSKVVIVGKNGYGETLVRDSAGNVGVLLGN